MGYRDDSDGVSSPTAIPPRPGSTEAKQQKKQLPAPQFKKRGARAEQRSNPLKNPWVIGGLVSVVVLVIGIISIVSTTKSPVDTGELAETRDVTSVGTPLPPYADDATPENDPATGLTAPVVTGANFEGIGVEIDPGAPTLVVFLAHWCPHCQAEVPQLVEWNANSEVPAGVRVVGVATATDERRDNYPPSEWLVRESFPWPVMADSADGDAAAAFGVTGYPFFAFVDADGTVQWRLSGEVAVDELTERIEASLAA